MTNKGRYLLVAIAVVFSLCLAVNEVHAAVPQTINYQGYLTNSSGAPVNGTVSIVFSLYDVQTGGSALWSETHVTVNVTNGVYSVILGNGNPTPVPVNLAFDVQYYLGVKIGTDSEMTPRQQLTSVSYAMRAKIADNVKYAKVAVVAQSGGDYTDPLTAMNNISTWCGTPSATNSCLLKIMPGVYNIGTNSLQMQQYVDIEGSGENITKITGHIDSGTSGVVNGASNAEIRFLIVENTGGGSYVHAIYSNNNSPTMTNVTATASGGTYGNYGVDNSTNSSPTMTNVTATGLGGTGTNFGVYNYYSSPKMTNVTATGSGGTNTYGVYNAFSSPKMTNVTATGSGGTGSNYGVTNASSSATMINVIATASGGWANIGVYNDLNSPTMTNVTAIGLGGANNYGVYSDYYGTVKIDHSVITGATNTIYNDSGVTTRVGSTRLDGGAVSNAGTLTCVGAYNGSYVALGTNCQ